MKEEQERKGAKNVDKPHDTPEFQQCSQHKKILSLSKNPYRPADFDPARTVISYI
jgi:hypothetical protein